MELPHIGKQCSEFSCKKLDFLPYTCDACKDIFCDEHYLYATHNCPKAYTKNNQVPVCPLCNIPIPVPRNTQPDIAVNAHIDNDCQSDPAKDRRKVFTNKCSRKGCKIKEVIPVVCNDCKYNYCLKHRHPSDHQCQGAKGAMRKHATEAAISRQIRSNTTNQNGFTTAVQGNISEDEALARALALSMQETHNNRPLSQESLDLALARQLQANETVTAGDGSARSNRCNVQ